MKAILLSLSSILVMVAGACTTAEKDTDNEKNPSYSPYGAVVQGVIDRRVRVLGLSSRLNKHEARLLVKRYPWFRDHLQSVESSEFEPFANTDEKRLNGLKETLADPTALVVWPTRGGHGIMRIISTLNQLSAPEPHPTVVGFSDVTALHLFVSQVWGWKSVHGGMVVDLVRERDPHNWLYLEKMLTKQDVFTYKGITAVSGASETSYQGRLTGGNLTLIANSLHTEWQIDAHDKIVLLEDVGEFNVTDRALHQLIQAGVLQRAAAIVVGNIDIPGLKKEGVLRDLAARVQVPVFSCDFIGHRYKNYPWIYNAEATLAKGERGQWELSFSNEGLRLLRSDTYAAEDSFNHR